VEVGEGRLPGYAWKVAERERERDLVDDGGDEEAAHRHQGIAAGYHLPPLRGVQPELREHGGNTEHPAYYVDSLGGA
jgi:hypothetical protein